LYERDGLVCDRKRIDGKQQLAPNTMCKVTRYFMNSNERQGLHKTYDDDYPTEPPYSDD